MTDILNISFESIIMWMPQDPIDDKWALFQVIMALLPEPIFVEQDPWHHMHGRMGKSIQKNLCFKNLIFNQIHFSHKSSLELSPLHMDEWVLYSHLNTSYSSHIYYLIYVRTICIHCMLYVFRRWPNGRRRATRSSRSMRTSNSSSRLL